MVCWKCGTRVEEISGVRRALRTETCSACGTDLHSCNNCRFHDRQYDNECRETQAEWVTDRERTNFCDYFAPGQ
jgi:hypothetical protein